MSAWISVEEALPKVDKERFNNDFRRYKTSIPLIVTYLNPVSLEYLVFHEAVYYLGFNKWQTVNGSDFNQEVVAWMPYPKPYMKPYTK